MVGASPTYLPLAFGIREQLTGLLTGTDSLSGFYRWFVETIDDAEADADDSTWDLFLAVENVLAEWTGDHLDDKETVQALRQVVEATLAIAKIE